MYGTTQKSSAAWWKKCKFWGSYTSLKQSRAVKKSPRACASWPFSNHSTASDTLSEKSSLARCSCLDSRNPVIGPVVLSLSNIARLSISAAATGATRSEDAIHAPATHFWKPIDTKFLMQTEGRSLSIIVSIENVGSENCAEFPQFRSGRFPFPTTTTSCFGASLPPEHLPRVELSLLMSDDERTVIHVPWWLGTITDCILRIWQVGQMGAVRWSLVSTEIAELLDAHSLWSPGWAILSEENCERKNCHITSPILDSRTVFCTFLQLPGLKLHSWQTQRMRWMDRETKWEIGASSDQFCKKASTKRI